MLQAIHSEFDRAGRRYRARYVPGDRQSARVRGLQRGDQYCFADIVVDFDETCPLFGKKVDRADSPLLRVCENPERWIYRRISVQNLTGNRDAGQRFFKIGYPDSEDATG